MPSKSEWLDLISILAPFLGVLGFLVWKWGFLGLFLEVAR